MIYCYNKPLIVIVFWVYLGWKTWSRRYKIELPFVLLSINVVGGYFMLLNVIGASQEGRKFPASGMWRSWSGLVKNPGGAVSPHLLQHLLFGWIFCLYSPHPLHHWTAFALDWILRLIVSLLIIIISIVILYQYLLQDYIAVMEFIFIKQIYAQIANS